MQQTRRDCAGGTALPSGRQTDGPKPLGRVDAIAVIGAAVALLRGNDRGTVQRVRNLNLVWLTALITVPCILSHSRAAAHRFSSCSVVRERAEYSRTRGTGWAKCIEASQAARRLCCCAGRAAARVRPADLLAHPPQGAGPRGRQGHAVEPARLLRGGWVGTEVDRRSTAEYPQLH